MARRSRRILPEPPPNRIALAWHTSLTNLAQRWAARVVARLQYPHRMVSGQAAVATADLADQTFLGIQELRPTFHLDLHDTALYGWGFVPGWQFLVRGAVASARTCIQSMIVFFPVPTPATASGFLSRFSFFPARRSAISRAYCPEDRSILYWDWQTS